MNIWLVNHYAVPPSLYPLGRTTNFAKNLIKEGHEVIIFAASMVHNSNINLINDKKLYKEEIVDGVHYVYVRTCNYRTNGFKRILNMFQFAFRLKKACRHFKKPNAILSSTATPLACMAGLKLSQKIGCRGVAEVSDLWPESFVQYGLINKKNPVLIPMYYFEKKLYQKADAIIFTMAGGADYIKNKRWDTKNRGAVDMSKVYHINNGVDIDEFENNRKNYIIEDKDLDNKNLFKVIYAGSIRKVNSLLTIVNTAEVLKRRDLNNIIFLIYGDGEEKEVLSKKCVDKGLENIVFKGSVNKKYIPYILSKADLNLVHGNATPIMKYGMSSNKLFEYFAAGKPILSDIETNYDLIKEYKAGIVINSQTPESLAEAIELICKSTDEFKNELSMNALKAAEDYDFNKLTKKLVSILE